MHLPDRACLCFALPCPCSLRTPLIASRALTGVRKGLDIVGVLTLAFLTSLGGGLIRDVLIGATPPVGLTDYRYIGTAVAAMRLCQKSGVGAEFPPTCHAPNSNRKKRSETVPNAIP